jgi:2-oxoglutarate/2-oxoacid ferredoxin oxidoreductase subunit alpha
MQHCRVLVVPEMNMGQMSREVKRVNNGRAQVRTLNRVDGQIIAPGQILKLLQKV